MIWCSPLDQQILAMSWSFCRTGSFEENLSLAFPEFHFPQSKKVYILSGKLTGSHRGADGFLLAGLAPALCEHCGAGATLQRSRSSWQQWDAKEFDCTHPMVQRHRGVSSGLSSPAMSSENYLVRLYKSVRGFKINSNVSSCCECRLDGVVLY